MPVPRSRDGALFAAETRAHLLSVRRQLLTCTPVCPQEMPAPPLGESGQLSQGPRPARAGVAKTPTGHLWPLGTEPGTIEASGRPGLWGALHRAGREPQGISVPVGSSAACGPGFLCPPTTCRDRCPLESRTQGEVSAPNMRPSGWFAIGLASDLVAEALGRSCSLCGPQLTLRKPGELELTPETLPAALFWGYCAPVMDALPWPQTPSFGGCCSPPVSTGPFSCQPAWASPPWAVGTWPSPAGLTLRALLKVPPGGIYAWVSRKPKILSNRHCCWSVSASLCGLVHGEGWGSRSADTRQQPPLLRMAQGPGIPRTQPVDPRLRGAMLVTFLLPRSILAPPGSVRSGQGLRPEDSRAQGHLVPLRQGPAWG